MNCIGLETARLLAAEGAHLILLARDPAKPTTACENVQTARRSPHQYVAAISVDVMDMNDVQTKLDQAVLDYGPPDILINSAGLLRSDYFEAISFDDFDLYESKMSYEEWGQRAIDQMRQNDFVALCLHDCYAHYWLPHYEGFLNKIKELGKMRTLDEVAAEVILQNCE